jgi:hypothetical protein
MSLMSLSDFVKDMEQKLGPCWRPILAVNENPSLVLDLPGVEDVGLEHYIIGGIKYYIGPGYMLGGTELPGGFTKFYISKTESEPGKISDKLQDDVGRGEGEDDGDDGEGGTYWRHNGFRGWSSRGSGRGLTLRGRGRGRGGGW